MQSLLGFDPTLDDHGAEVYWALTLCMALIPAFFSFVAAILTPKIAITERRHGIIRRRLEAREARAQWRRSTELQQSSSELCFS